MERKAFLSTTKDKYESEGKQILTEMQTIMPRCAERMEELRKTNNMLMTQIDERNSLVTLFFSLLITSLIVFLFMYHRGSVAPFLDLLRPYCFRLGILDMLIMKLVALMRD